MSSSAIATLLYYADRRIQRGAAIEMKLNLSRLPN